MSKPLTEAYQLSATKGALLGDARSNLGGIKFAAGNTVPTDADTGYATGCVWLKLNGSAGTALYINEGTVSSCDFNPVVLPGVDLSGLTATATEINRVADFSAIGGIPLVKKLSITTTPTGSEQDTGYDLPAKCVVLGVWVDVTTVEAVGGTKTLDVGTLSSESGGDADGFLDGISVASTTGLRQGSLVSGAVTLGALFRETVTDGGTNTHSARLPYLSTANTAKSVSYTAGSNDFTAFRGDIYIAMLDLSGTG